MNALLLSVLVLAADPPATVPAEMDPGDVPNYVVAAPQVATGGLPTPEGLDALSARGVRTLLDLRPPSEAKDFGNAVRAKGLRYVNVPVTPGTFTAADAAAVEKALADPEAGPTLLHCASGNRSGGVWAVLRFKAGASRAEAMAEGERVGLKSAAMKEAAARVIDEVAAPK